jgi:hypothetical protein
LKKKKNQKENFCAKLRFAFQAQFEKWKYDQGREILPSDEAGLTAAKRPASGHADIFQTSPKKPVGF